MNELRKRGVPVSRDILNIDEAEEELYRLLKQIEGKIDA
jgi:hypothetical protein